MPCFKGLAVSIHAEGPLAEHSVQKQSRNSRISSYISVPPAQIPKDSLTGRPEQAKFAISITLLTPGLNVPYSTPTATSEDPFPRPRVVGGLPGYTSERGRYASTVPPYVPRTTNPNETVAAYIYFDGRAKEEVATLLRRGEETWVNSRWVSVPESEGGGLAEREFLFREVGLERWLNGLDLEGGKNKQERIERRQRRLEKKQRKAKDQLGITSDDDDDDLSLRKVKGNGVLRYGNGNNPPVEDVMQRDDVLSSDSDSDDDPPQPEAAGQIKVALFRVLASGEIKRGEYSPQFDAHDDDEDHDGSGKTGGNDEEVDHTTSFAKPKSLDPKTISTQTVTGLDPPESPYAVFTFFYRGEKQLQKMGIIQTPEVEKTPVVAKQKKSGTDFSKLGPLKAFGTVGFSGYRDTAGRRKGNRNDDAMDSDNEDDERARMVDGEDETQVKPENGKLLSPEDAKRTGELADGVQKIKLKRQHSAEPIADAVSTRKSPHLKTSESPSAGTPQSGNSVAANPGTPPADNATAALQNEAAEVIGSPYKRQRASLSGLDGGLFAPLAPAVNAPVVNEAVASNHDSPQAGSHDQQQSTSKHAIEPQAESKMADDEEL